MNLDEELRSAMADHADDAPHGTSLLDGVRGRVRRADLRRRLLAVAAVVVAVVAVVVGTPFALDRRSLPPGGPTATPTGNLVRPEYELPTFPLTPSWVPDGLSAPHVGRALDLAVVEYVSADGGLIVQVGSDDPTVQLPDGATSRETRIGSVTGTLWTFGADGRSRVWLTWRLADGRWVDVYSGGRLTPAEVERFARRLTLTPMPPTTPAVTLALAPRGYVLTELFADRLCLAPSLEVGRTANLCVGLSDMSLGQGNPVSVGGRPAEIVEGGKYREVRVSVRDDVTVVVSATATLDISRDDLIRIAAGVTVNER